MRLIYACYQTYLCLLSNVAMLAVKCSYACYQMYLCLLSNMFFIAEKYILNVSRHSSLLVPYNY